MWSDIVGHAAQIELLKSYVDRDRVPHALLFTGLEGLGKSRVARELFRAINCQTTPGDPCGSCPACLKTENKTHPDLVCFEPPSSGKQIDLLRGVLADIRLKPFEARTRMVLIEPAERMNKSSSNALLKALEEPPEATIFVLVSHKPNLLLSTIISRCQTLRFAPIEGGGYRSANVDPLLLKLSGGTMGGLSRLEKADVLGFRESLIEVLNGGDPFALAARHVPESKEEIPYYVAVAESVVRDVLLVFNGGDRVINPEIAGCELRRLSYHEMESISAGIGALRRGAGENLNLKIAFADFFLRLSRLAA